MGFKIKASRSGHGAAKTQLSVAAAPYQVTFKDGRKCFYGELKEIYEKTSIHDVTSVFDRHKKAFLDLDVIWNHHRRKFITGVAADTGGRAI